MDAHMYVQDTRSPYMVHVIIPILWTKSQMYLKAGY